MLTVGSQEQLLIFPHVTELNIKHMFYVLLVVHPNIMIVFFYQLHAQILYFNAIIIYNTHYYMYYKKEFVHQVGKKDNQ